MEALELENELELLAPAVDYGAERHWSTVLSDVRLKGEGGLEVNLTRPESGPAKGGYLYVFKNIISRGNTPIIRQYLEGRKSGKFEISSDEINWRSGTYWLAYGPHFSHQINLVATSIEIDHGAALTTNSSVCRSISHEMNRVTSFFKFDPNDLGFGRYKGYLIVREGDVLGEGAQVGIAEIPTSGPSSGIQEVLTSTLKRGKTYNVSANVYSKVRPVAGYTFTRAR